MECLLLVTTIIFTSEMFFSLKIKRHLCKGQEVPTAKQTKRTTQFASLPFLAWLWRSAPQSPTASRLGVVSRDPSLCSSSLAPSHLCDFWTPLCHKHTLEHFRRTFKFTLKSIANKSDYWAGGTTRQPHMFRSSLSYYVTCSRGPKTKMKQ